MNPRRLVDSAGSAVKRWFDPATRRVLVLGGTRSGKSRYAENLLAAKADVCCLATGPIPHDDPEWAEGLRLAVALFTVAPVGRLDIADSTGLPGRLTVMGGLLITAAAAADFAGGGVADIVWPVTAVLVAFAMILSCRPRGWLGVAVISTVRQWLRASPVCSGQRDAPAGPVR